MPEMMLVRYYHPAAGSDARLGVQINDQIHDVSESVPSVGAWLKQSANRVVEAISELHTLAEQAQTRYPAEEFANAPSAHSPHLLAPVDTQEVWAAGVTYERSREARQEESQDGGDVYARVYEAARPEIFFKAAGWRVIGPYGEVGIRADADWSVPEPELGIVYNPAMEVVGFTIGNDMSSRDIEGANPLYLPQAKVYTASCALGPGIALTPSQEWPVTLIRITIERDEIVMFKGDVHTDRIKRRIKEFTDYLGRSIHFPEGVILLTGTGTVPPSDFTLLEDDEVTVQIDSIGTLSNRVIVV